jgi:hypothetical protein
MTGINSLALRKLIQERNPDKSLTDLDNGRGVPACVYCIRPYFKHKGVWLPQDAVKIGKANSILNRTRTYAQPGPDPRTLWTINVTEQYEAQSLENWVKNALWWCTASKVTPATEVYEITDTQAMFVAHQVLKYTNKHRVKILDIEVFDNINEYDTGSYSSLDQTMYYKYFNF